MPKIQFAKIAPIIAAFISVTIPVWLSAADSGMIVEQALAFQFSHKTITGASVDTSARFLIPLSDSQDVLWKDNRLEIGVLNSFTPTYNQTFLTLKLVPIAIFDIALKGGLMPIFNIGGPWGYFPLSGPNIRLTNSGTGGNVLSYWMTVSPTLKIPLGFLYGGKIDQLALMNTLDLHVSMIPGYTGYYIDHFSAYYLKGEVDWYMYNNTYLVFEAIEKTLMVGFNMNILSMPTVNYAEYRPGAVAIWTPKTDWARDTYVALIAGFNLTKQEGYFALQAGANWKVF